MARSLLSTGLLTLGVALAGCGSGSSQSGSSGQPAATVNGRAISMITYTKELTVLRRQSEQTAEAIDPCNAGKTFAAFCSQLKRTALTGVINDEIVRQYARAHHITLTDAEFQQQWAIIFSSKYHSNDAVLKAQARSYGLTVADIKASARQKMLQDKVMYEVTKKLSMYAPMVRVSIISVRKPQEMQTVLKQLKANAPFNQVAAQLATDRSGLCAQGTCGDRGWFPIQLIPPQEQEVAMTAPGHTAGPFSGQGGQSLILVEARDQHHQLNATQELAIRQQTFAKWLAGQSHKASVRRYAAT